MSKLVSTSDVVTVSDNVFCMNSVVSRLLFSPFYATCHIIVAFGRAMNHILCVTFGRIMADTEEIRLDYWHKIPSCGHTRHKQL